MFSKDHGFSYPERTTKQSGKHKYEKLEVVQPRINKRSKLPVGE